MTDAETRDFWANRSVMDGDFDSITRQLLAKVLSSDILTPIEEADKGLRLQVKHISLGRYLTSITEGNAIADLSGNDIVVRRIQQLVSSSSASRIGITTRDDLLLFNQYVLQRDGQFSRWDGGLSSLFPPVFHLSSTPLAGADSGSMV
jgi:hypothetical protein